MRTGSPGGWIGCALALALACGDSPQVKSCQLTADCPAGQVCLVGRAGGACAAPPFSVELRAPDPGARAGAAGLAVEARVTLAADDAALPERVEVVVDGGLREVLPYVERDGRALTYRGVWTPIPEDQGQKALWVAVVTPAGALPSDAVLVEVDGAPPVVDGLFAGCAGACVRDGDLTVYADVREPNVAAVEAFTSLDAFQAPVALAPSGLAGNYVGAVKLGALPFPWFSRQVTVRVRVRDAVGNEATAEATPVEVSRGRWAVDLRANGQGPVGLTGAAVLPDGTALLGKLDGQVYAIGAGGTVTWSTSIAVHAAPSIGGDQSYFASDDGKLYAIAADRTVTSCPAAGAVPGALYTPAVSAEPDVAYAGGSAGALISRAGGGACGSLGLPGGKAASGPVVIAGSWLAVPLVDNLSHYVVGVLSADGSQVDEVGAAQGLTPCSRIEAPLVADGCTVYVACGSGELYAVDLQNLLAHHLLDLPGAATASPALFPDGSLLVGTNDGRLHRLAPPATAGGSWTEAWSPASDLGAPVTGVLVAAPDGDGVVAYAVTAAGALHAVDAAGAVRWSAAGEGAPLGRFALTWPTIAPAAEGRLPTLVVGSAEGVVHAVVVDGALEASSPWPKAHHDLRNTGRAGAPLP